MAFPQPPPLAAVAARSVEAATADQLQSAFADPSVSAVVVTAHIALPSPLALSGVGRALSVSADPARCAARPAFASAATGRPVPHGFCGLDAPSSGGRHFTVTLGASLSLSCLALLGGRGPPPPLGGSVLALSGASLSASAVLFADSASMGDGGALFAASPGTVATLTDCVFLNCSSAAGAGGAAAAAFGASLTVHAGSGSGCSAQSGGAFAAVLNATLAVKGTAVGNCSSLHGGGGAVAVAYGSSASIS